LGFWTRSLEQLEVRHSPHFWRTLLICGLFWLATIGLLGAVIDRNLTDNRDIWLVAAISGLVILMLALALARSLVPSLDEFSKAADNIARGQFGQKVYGSTADEAKLLARSFNHMSEQLAIQFAQVEEDRQQLRTILSGMVEGVIALDGGQRVLFANDRAAQLLEFQSLSIVGRKLWEVVRVRALQDIVFQALDSDGPYQGELEWNGSTCRILTVHAARLLGMPARGAVLVFHDTTELRRLERLRQDFVANVSHELKTPLAVIAACVETLLDWAGEEPAMRTKFLEQIADQSTRLHALIIDLLSLARIESGETAFDRERVHLEPLVVSCLERHRARAAAKNQLLELVPPQRAFKEPGEDAFSSTALAIDVVAWVDEEAASQILDNLVDNAVKYTPEGGRIRVSWGVESDHAFLQVEDSGIGIPETDLPRIFERFYRVDNARSREMGGTGLGLSIVKHLVQAMQGNIQATSQLGQGTKFFIRLPLSASV
jgi:two-component system, OmpR family, phosphate regulon sensor histidine kinase PhoR